MLTEVRKGVFRWEGLEIKLKRHLNGWLLITPDGPMLVDPPQAAEPDIADIELRGKPKIILLTGKRQERRTKMYQGWYQARVYAPRGDEKLLEVEPFRLYEDGEALPGGFVAMRLANQRSPGESVLFHKAARLLVAGHLVGAPAGQLQMQEKHLYSNFSKAFAEQVRLLKLDFDALLPGRGEPVMKEARVRLAEHLATFALPDGI